MKQYAWMLFVVSLISFCGLAAMSTQNQKDLNEEFVEKIKSFDSTLKSPNLQNLQNIIDQGADVNAVDEDGNSVISLAVIESLHGNPLVLDIILKLLIKNGADINARNKKNHLSSTPVINLLQSSFDEKQTLRILGSLLKNGADITLPTQVNKEALGYSDPFSDKEDKHTPIQLAKSYKELALAEFLKKFDEGLKKFLDKPIEFKSIQVGNDVLDRDFFKKHIENALKSKTYNPERIALYIEQKKKMLEKANKNQFTDALIFTVK